MRITLPMPPNMANKSFGHWAKKGRARDEYMMLAMVLSQDVKRPRKPFHRARISVTLYTWNPMDRDNLTARLKWPIDFLVERGVIVDDGPKCLESEMPKQAIDRKHMRVEIELEAIA